MDLRKQLKNDFERLYNGCTLVCIQLDSFSHKVYLIENGEKKIEEYSHYMGDSENKLYRCSDRTIELFKHIPQTAKYGAQEIIYIQPEDLYKYL